MTAADIRRWNSRFWILLERGFLVVFFILTMASGSAVVYWALVDSAPPLRVLNDGGKPRDHAVTPKVTRGGVLQVMRHYCVDRQISGEINRRIIDTVVFSYPRADAYTEVGCYDGRIHTVDVPSILPNGRYIYKVTATYELNPLRTIVVQLPEIPFEVVDEPSTRRGR